MAETEIELADEAATARLGQDLATALRAGDVVALEGELGAGKSTLARALIRALAGDAELEVPSPTFTLVQTYATHPPVSHFDLYRLGSPEELDELGFEDALREGAAMVEWPERAGTRLPPSALTVSLAIRGVGRIARISGEGPLAARASRSLAARRFLEGAGWGGAERRPLTPDASARSYDVVTLPGQKPHLLMDAPPLMLGPPVKNGLTYAEIAHTARSVHAFVALDEALAAAGFAVPEIVAQDVGQGFLLIEHLGQDGMVDAEGRPIATRYEAAARLLAALHRHRWDPRIAARDGFVHDVPPFGRDTLAIETELLLRWFVPFATGAPPSEALERDFAAAWDKLFGRLEQSEQSLVLRDIQAPNLIWRDEREGHDRIGLIDFQDALIGPAAYDVASLGMDARVTIPPELEARIKVAYEAARAGDGRFDPESFREAYAIAAAQRHTKILGIFVRLKQRDGKDGYIRHLPRIQRYLARALTHPTLAELRALYAEHGFLGDAA